MSHKAGFRLLNAEGMGKRLGRILQKYVKRTTPDSLAAIRILTCLVLVASTVWEDFASSALLPISMRQPMGFLELFYVLPGFEAFARSQAMLGAFEWFTIVVLLLGCVGYFTRVTLPLGALCYFVLAGIIRQYAWYYHTGLIPLYMLAAGNTGLNSAQARDTRNHFFILEICIKSSFRLLNE